MHNCQGGKWAMWPISSLHVSNPLKDNELVEGSGWPLFSNIAKMGHVTLFFLDVFRQ